jgi:hypothetical protein
VLCFNIEGGGWEVRGAERGRQERWEMTQSSNAFMGCEKKEIGEVDLGGERERRRQSASCDGQAVCYEDHVSGSSEYSI